MRNRIVTAVLLALCSASALALTSRDAGVFVALNEDGEPVEKVFRVSQTPVGWRFEDRQPDGSWLDVTCHGGCEHRTSTTEDLVAFFGAPPPPHITPDCVQNEQYAFCHLSGKQPGNEREGYVLVVRAGPGWHPVSMVRLPVDPDQEAPGAPAAQESARWES